MKLFKEQTYEKTAQYAVNIMTGSFTCKDRYFGITRRFRKGKTAVKAIAARLKASQVAHLTLDSGVQVILRHCPETYGVIIEAPDEIRIHYLDEWTSKAFCEHYRKDCRLVKHGPQEYTLYFGKQKITKGSSVEYCWDYGRRFIEGKIETI